MRSERPERPVTSVIRHFRAGKSSQIGRSSAGTQDSDHTRIISGPLEHLIRPNRIFFPIPEKVSCVAGKIVYH